MPIKAPQPGPNAAGLQFGALAAFVRESPAAERHPSTGDVARFARRKSVCERRHGAWMLAWEKRFLSPPDLTASLAPHGVQPTDPWLLRRLARAADRHLLALLSQPEQLRNTPALALDLDFCSILSPHFLRFDEALPDRLRGRVVLGLLPAGILSDPRTFALARSFARARQYRLLLRGITAPLVPLLAFEQMELDYIQLRWTPALQTCDLAPVLTGAAPIVLSRVDDPSALRWGQDVGIRLFQGHMVRPTSELIEAQPTALAS